MSSIRRVQTERLLEDVVHTLYSEGVRPMSSAVIKRISNYFSKYPAGKPLPFPIEDALAMGRSDPDAYNILLAHLAVNLDVLYDVSLRQVDDILSLTASLQSDLSRLKKKRRRVETLIDDYLLSTRNADGYFYSISDNFSDTELSDLSLTTAEVDTEMGTVILPTISSRTTKVPPRLISNPVIDVTAAGSSHPFTVLAPFSGAIQDSLDNILWAFEVETDAPQEVVATANIQLGDVDPIELSRIDFSPYGGTPVQVFFHTRNEDDGDWVDFGSKIHTGLTKMIFSSVVRSVSSLRMTLRKTEPDYTEHKDGQLVYKYIFGAKDISFLYQVYDPVARFVSEPLFLPGDYENDFVIDAVSLDVDVEVPSDTKINYYVAPSDGLPLEDLDDVLWSEIVPIASRDLGRKVVRFRGAMRHRNMIRQFPRSDNDMQLLPIVTSGPVAERNPSPTIIEGVDIYRIAEIDDVPLLNSLELSEGVNATRIYSRNVDNFTEFNDIDLDYWADRLNEGTGLTVDYGRIDAGNESFYGGDVGANGKDIYVETFLEMDRSLETFLAEFQKVDVRSQTWDVKVYLNGRLLGNLPVGTQRMQLPWNLRQGLNHVVLLIRIPLESAVLHHFMGTLSLMGDNPPLQHYGRVRLAKWRYVDMFNMRYNETGEPFTFTIHEGEIVSRRKPTTNFQIEYATSTNNGPPAVRLRAELERARNSATVSPQLRSYRLRFAYGD